MKKFLAVMCLPPCDNVPMSWNDANTTDSLPVMVKGQDVGAPANLLGGTGPPCPY